MKPPVAKTRLAPEVRARVLELRRTHSTADVARQTGLPIGTVKALASRAGMTRNNTAARAFFALPPLVQASTTAVAAPAALPVQRNVTGDTDTDAMLWLREVIQTGDSALIATAMQAAKRVKTPVKELERRYGDYLLRAWCAAAKLAGLERVLCVVREMDDDEATLRNASDNVATPPPWFDLCLYVYRNAVKDSKKGLSAADLTKAATGKDGQVARNLSVMLRAAGEVIEQSNLEVTLLDADSNITRHCAAISANPLPEPPRTRPRTSYFRKLQLWARVREH